jgi:glycosyltransferase involved in cell wall biosynthesis
VLQALMKRRSDVVHIHIGGQPSARLLGLCLVASLIPWTRSVLTFHSGGFATSPSGRRARRFSAAGFVFRRFDRVIAVSEEIASVFERYGVSRSQLRVIAPHAVDVSEAGEPFSPLTAADSVLEFVDAHSPVLVTVGCLEPEYDLEFQIAAFAQIRNEHPSAGLVIVGGGSLHDRLRSTIEGSPAPEHVLLCGDLRHADTLRLIRRADALLRTTRYDGDSISVREALALGTPVVATSVSARPSGVYLFTIGDESGFLRAVRRAIAGGRVSAELADYGSVDPVIALYNEVLSQQPNRREANGGTTVDRGTTRSG